MYSIVLMMAMTSGAEAPAHHKDCHGYSGWHSYSYASCHGYSSCHRSWSLCHKSCHAYSSCYSSCTSSCHTRHKLFGGHCHGSCHGYVACSGSSCHGAYYEGCHGAPVTPAPAKTMPAPEQLKAAPKQTLNAAPATIVVSLPAEAKLLVDGDATSSTSTVRVFQSPALEQNQTYYYTLNGELLRDGQIVKTSQRVAVRAGEETRVELNFAPVALAQK